jgi:hypothetical protein
MQLYLQIIILSFSLIILGSVWELIRHGQLRPAYGLIWMIGAVGFFLFSIFASLVHIIAAFFNVSYAPSVIISLALGFIIIMLLSQSVIISNLSRNNKDLAQNYAILEWRLENIEKRTLDSEISQ